MPLPTSSSNTTTRPAFTSEWPARYLVAEWMTISAPKSSGCCRYGVTNVLSTMDSAPYRCAMAEMRLTLLICRQRVGQRLEIYGAGRAAASVVPLISGVERLVVGGVDAVELQPALGEVLVEQRIRAAVDVLADHDAAPGLKMDSTA